MNTIELLRTASEMEKKAFVEYATNFTSAGITALVKGGVPFEQASNIVKQACERDPVIQSLNANIQAFEKSAEYIAELEAQVGSLEKVAEETNLTVATLDTNNPMSKLAALGFSPDEIRLMSELPENLLTKVASANAPYEMGGGVGIPREKTDPLLEWLTS
mgnify:FL=1